MKRAKPGTGITSFQHTKPDKVARSRELRKRATPAEEKLWELIRGRKVAGLKFRRQQVIEGFITDFFCDEAKLVIEVDGSVHDNPQQKKQDAYREEVFRARGLTTLRCRNEEVLKNCNEVVERIAVLRLPHPSVPSPPGEGMSLKSREK